jgi:hypothetical protein
MCEPSSGRCGADAENQKLSELRAASAAKFVTTWGIDAGGEPSRTHSLSTHPHRLYPVKERTNPPNAFVEVSSKSCAKISDTHCGSN